MKTRHLTSTEPPRDRLIHLVANVVNRDGCHIEVDPFRGLARWHEPSGDWVDQYGRSIRAYYEAELVILEWAETYPPLARPDYPLLALPPPVSVSAAIYHWDSESRRERGDAGFFAVLDLQRDDLPMGRGRYAGPFPSQREAIAALSTLLEEIHGRAARAA